MSRRIAKYLLWFANEHVNFRAEDVRAVAKMLQINVNYVTEVSETPFCIVELESESAAKQLASRCISLRSILELWGWGQSYNELHEQVREVPASVMQPHFVIDKSFRVYVETFCKTTSHKEKVDKIELFSYLPLEGPVSLNNPDVKLYLLEYYGMDSNNIPDQPYQLFFGRWIADGQRNLITKLSLKNRKFLGNTSMDAQLSLIMANQAQVQNGHVIFDPFVGSGSLLVAAAQFGGYVWGGDLDYLMLHGKSKPVRPKQKVRASDESIKSNMIQYGLSSHYLDVLVADASLPIWKSGLKFDAIITDPPYGIRESIEKIGSSKGIDVQPISEAHLESHIPSKIEYNLQHLLQDLLDFAALHLELGGRLVFWMPVYRLDYDAEPTVPIHECLQLESNCEQVLCGHTSRRLLTMVKTKQPSNQTPAIVPECTASFRYKYFNLSAPSSMDLK